jgi:hypothetical protein
MTSLWQLAARDALHHRLARLEADTPARWGRMTCPQMLAHVNDALRMASGTLPVAPRGLALRFPPVKQLVIYLMPWPHGAPTAPELLARVDAAAFEHERGAFPELLDSFAARSGARDWPDHPAFGTMSRRSWGVLAYRHVDHHFRQFGA